MDQVYLTRRQLRVLADKDVDYFITATNEDARMLFVEPAKYIGAGKGVWLKPDGQTREGKKL